VKKRDKLLLLAAVFGILGLANLAVMNFWLVPAAWPEHPEVAEAPAAGAPAASQVSGAEAATAPVSPVPTEKRAAVAPSPPPATVPPAAEPAQPVAEPPEPAKPATRPAAEKILPPPADEPTPDLEEVPGVNFLQFYYGDGQCQVTDSMKLELEPILERLRQQTDLVVHIEGHTDPSGSPAGHYNMSALRAGFAAAYFQKMGVAASRIKQHLRGANAAKLMPPSMWHKNRRVVVRIFKRR
jgi:outer membrane protein OmpA-like peptidoglycan-associated protein